MKFTWHDGFPLQKSDQAVGGMWTTGEGNGYEFKVAADTVLRTLKVYVAVWNGGGKLEAFLNDNSPVYQDNSLKNMEKGENGVYILKYRCSQPGQFLTVRYLNADTYQNGNANIYAATLY